MSIQSPNSKLPKIANDQAVPHPSPLPGGCVTINERPLRLQVGTGGQVTKLWTCLREAPPCGTKEGPKLRSLIPPGRDSVRIYPTYDYDTVSSGEKDGVKVLA